jgi:site-specific recombinase XerD
MAQSILETYLDHFSKRTTRKQKAAPATIRAARADLQGFITWWEQAKALAFDAALILDTDLLDWHTHRQETNGVKPSTLNRARTHLLGFFAWAQAQGLLSHNPAMVLPLLEQQEIAPRSTPPEGVEWLFRVASGQDDPTTRLRDLALLTLLSDCGLRSQEAADLQLRDLDLDAETLTVRSGKRGKARRLPLPPTAVRRLRDYLHVRCPGDLPAIGSDAERAPLLIARHVAQPGQPWEPGMQPVSMRKLLAGLGQAAAAKVREQAKKAERRTHRRTGDVGEAAGGDQPAPAAAWPGVSDAKVERLAHRYRPGVGP